MLFKLSLRNAKRSMKDYLIYMLTMAGIVAFMFAFDSLIFTDIVQNMGNRHGHGGDDRFRNLLHRAHRRLADQLYGSFYAGKTEPGIPGPIFCWG